MLSAIGRAAVKRVAAGGPQSTNRAYYGFRRIERATISCGGDAGLVQRFNGLSICGRSYATTTRAPPKPKSTTTKAKAPAKPRSTATASKKSTKAATKKPAKKPLKKKVAAKPKKKAPPKKKPVKKAVKSLTPEQQEKASIRVLKKAALSAPKKKPFTAWGVYLAAEAKKNPGVDVPTLSKASAQSFKALGPAELESLNHTVNQNKAENEIAFKKWVETHTPQEINAANNARVRLRSKYNVTAFFKLADARLPKQPMRPINYFLRDRYASGDIKGIKLTDASRLINQEWRELPESDKKVYVERSEADSLRYAQEMQTVMPDKKLRLTGS